MTNRRSTRPPHDRRPDTPAAVVELRPELPTQPPVEAHAEQAVLGAMLTDPTTIEAVTAHITPDDHWQIPHTLIHRAILAVAATGTQPDPISVHRHLLTADNLRHLPDGAVYLHTCIAALPTAANAGYYARLIADAARRRHLDQAGIRLRQYATIDDPERRDQLIAELRTELDQHLTPAAPTADGHDTWQPINLEPALTGGVLTPPPVLLARTDGQFLLYLGRLHSLAGEPESGKTWIALVAVAQALHDGQHVIYLDFEDTPEGIVGRLLALGAHPHRIRSHLHYIRPDRPIDTPARSQLATLVADNFTVLAVIDGVTEAMTLHGLDPYNNPDAAKFYDALPRHLTHLPAPPAVLLIDHVPKDEDRPKRYAIGAQHKLAGLDGAAYMVDIVKPFAPGTPGISRIRVAKDRPGQVRKTARNGIIADLHVQGDDQVVVAELRPPLTSTTATTPDRHWRPTLLMERVSLWLEAHPGAALADIEEGVRGRSANIRAAVEALVVEKFVRREPGERGRMSHHSKEPFRNTPESEEINSD